MLKNVKSFMIDCEARQMRGVNPGVDVEVLLDRRRLLRERLESGEEKLFASPGIVAAKIDEALSGKDKVELKPEEMAEVEDYLDKQKWPDVKLREAHEAIVRREKANLRLNKTEIHNKKIIEEAAMMRKVKLGAL